MTTPTKGFFKHDIVYVENFITPDECTKLVEYFKEKEGWQPVAFYGSYGMSILHDPDLQKFGLPAEYFDTLKERLKDAVEDAHSIEVRTVSTHAQKWIKGAYANWHSDNSDMEGNPTAWEVSKLVCLLYLNDDYEGGQLAFRDHDISISPSAGMLVTFPGGIHNVHAVTEVTEGVRYTIGAFWDHADATYTDERREEWKLERERVKAQQEVQYAEWAKGNKNA